MRCREVSSGQFAVVMGDDVIAIRVRCRVVNVGCFLISCSVFRYQCITVYTVDK